MTPQDTRFPSNASRSRAEEALDRANGQWLASEARGLDAEAELWFGRTVDALPVLTPSPGLADRVLNSAFGRAEGVWAAFLNRLQHSALGRRATIALVALFVVGGMTLPSVLGTLHQLVGRPVAASWTAELLLAGAGRVGDGLTWLRSVGTLRQALMSVLAEPSVMFFSWAALGVSLAAFVGLRGLVESQRRKQYVDF